MKSLIIVTIIFFAILFVSKIIISNFRNYVLNGLLDSRVVTLDSKPWFRRAYDFQLWSAKVILGFSDDDLEELFSSRVTNAYIDDNTKFSIVESIDQVLENINQFNYELVENSSIIKKLSQFKHWYYSPKLDLFGPSKFIGYKEMNVSKYEACIYVYGFDGRDTEAALKKWSKLASEKEFVKLNADLHNLLLIFAKNPNKGCKIHILNE